MRENDEFLCAASPQLDKNSERSFMRMPDLFEIRYGSRHDAISQMGLLSKNLIYIRDDSPNFKILKTHRRDPISGSAGAQRRPALTISLFSGGYNHAYL
jgi:hypothetical protein